ncbi:MAG: hypothetical protein ACODAQ_07630, partial [Phycisphaeraceae bacterium]
RPRFALMLLLALGIAATTSAQDRAGQATWPPAIPGADDHGGVRLTGDGFLQTPEDLTEARDALEGAFEFTVAADSPTVELVYHGQLPHPGVGPGNGTGWTSWGDICVASDGSVYVAIGDHGTDMAKEGEDADASVFVYRWSPSRHVLERICDPNAVVNAGPDDPNWSKIHAGIHEADDGRIYFVPTFNSGQRAPQARWTDHVPAAQIFQYDPASGETQVVGLLPPDSATATSELDRERHMLYLNLEGAHDDALFAFDLRTMQPTFQGPDGMIGANRNMALGNDGAIYYNAAEGHIGRFDPDTQTLSDTGITLPGGRAIRSSTRQASDGWIYATTYGGEHGRNGQLIRFHPGQQKLEMLGPDFLRIGRNGEPAPGNYTTVTILSPDERFVYYLPGAHGGAVRIGTPVVQYEIATGTRKVLAFLRPVMEREAEYVPGGTYGAKLSADGSTLYVNLNGHAIEENRLERMKPNGFGLTAFVAIHIPPSER